MEASSRQGEAIHFYDFTRKILKVGSKVGILPIKGLEYSTSEYLRFSWKSFLVFVPVIIFQIMILCFFLFDCIDSGMKLERVPGLTLHTSTIILYFYFMKLSYSFKNIIKKMEILEIALPGSPIPSARRKKKFLIVFVYIISTTVCYLFNNLSALPLVKNCHILNGDSGLYMKSFFILTSSYIFHHVPFSYSLGIMLQTIKLFIQFVWCYSDILFIISSIYLEDQFKNFNRVLFKKNMKKNLARLDWSAIQRQYTQLTKLVKIIDKFIGPISFLVLIADLFILGTQLFFLFGFRSQLRRIFFMNQSVCNEWSNRGDLMLQNVTLVISAMITTARMYFILLSAARLHSAGRAPLKLFGRIPASAYNDEVQRFMDQVYYSKVGLTGFQMFYFTKETVLSVLASLIAFELVLFQL